MNDTVIDMKRMEEVNIDHKDIIENCKDQLYRFKIKNKEGKIVKDIKVRWNLKRTQEEAYNRVVEIKRRSKFDLDLDEEYV